MKAIREIGIKKTIRFIGTIIFDFVFSLMIFPPIRVWFLRLLGAQIGKNVIIHQVRFINLYRGSLANLHIGNNCFLGGEVLLDLADKIILGDQVTVAERSIILTHLNVGYYNHPLQPYFPAYSKPTRISTGVFIGVASIILGGIKIGEKSFVAAGSVVTKDVAPLSVVGGVPAKLIRKLKND